MADDWRHSTWGEEISLEYGKALRGYSKEHGTYRVFGSNGPIGWTSEPLVQGPGVILGRKGAYRGVEYSSEPFWVIDTAYYVVPKTELNLRWIYYAIKHYKLGEIDDGSPIPSTTRAAVYVKEVHIPPRRDQEAIACILGALDDKIELNRTMNRTLEATARAIFKSWFVDFDPVRAKAAGQKPAGLKPDIAALFPDAFEESELGPIPKGWKITSLADQITASKGLSYKGQYLCAEGEGLPMHNLNSVYEGGGYKHEGLKWYKGEYRPAHLLKPGDVIVTNTEQGFDYLLIGYSAIVPERYGPQGLFSHHLFRIRPKPTSYLPAWFTYLLLRTRRFHDLVAGHSNGTTVNMLPLDGLQKPKFVLPPEALVKRFETLFVPAQQRIEQIHDENASLAALRDTLLPKLISGELVVAEAERIAGRCV